MCPPGVWRGRGFQRSGGITLSPDFWSRVRGCPGWGNLDRGWSHNVLSDGVLAPELVNSGSQPGVRGPWISG